MNVGFSSMVCPDWDFPTMVAKAAEMGFDGLELGVSRDARLSTQAVEAAADTQAARGLLADHHVELPCLGGSFPLTQKDPGEVRAGLDTLIETIELAGKLGCPYVRTPLGPLARLDTRGHALSRAADAFAALVPHAVAHGVTILVENGGDFPDSRAVWFILDAVSHPAVLACWNPCVGLGAGERPTISIPRLGRRTGMVHVCDARFDDRGVLREYRLPGKGGVEWARAIALLKGVGYDGYLMFHWPKALEVSLPEPDKVLPDVRAYLRGRIEDHPPVLSAYQRDKHAPNYGKLAG